MAVATAPQVQPISFSKASLRKRALMTSFTVNPALGGQWTPEINSQGFMAGIRLLFNLTDTVGTANNSAQNADYPWAIINRWQLQDSLGSNLHNLKGYSAYVAAKYFQPYMGREFSRAVMPYGGSITPVVPDARLYVATLTGATSALPQVFAMDFPVETDNVQHLGLMPNQNASFRYLMSISWEQSANLLTAGGGGTNTWAGQVQPIYEYYTVPQPTRGDGMPQMTMPPYPGVTRQLRDESFICPTGGSGGISEVRYNFVPGMVTRGFALIARGNGGPRTGNSLTTGIQRVKVMYGDDILLGDWTQQDFVTEHWRRYEEMPPTGVYPFQWIRDLAGIVGQSRSVDVLDTRNLAQFYLLITTGTDVYSIDVVHDDLIVPGNMSL